MSKIKLLLIAFLLFFAFANANETTRFQQYIQENNRAPVYNNYLPHVYFYMPRYSSKYAPRYTFGHSLNLFMMDDYSFNYIKERKHIEAQEKNTYVSPDEFKIR